MDKEVFSILEKDPILNSVVYSHKELIKFRPRLKKIKKKDLCGVFFTCSAKYVTLFLTKNPVLNY